MPVIRGQPGSLKDRFRPQEAKDHSPVGRLRGKDVKDNQPPPKQDSKEEEDDEEAQYRWGRAQSLQGFWSNVKDDPKRVTKRNVKMDMHGVPIVLESEPVELEGVIKCTTDPAADRQVDLESGHTAKLASRFLKYQEESTKTTKPKSFQMDLASEGPVILENEPEHRDDVVRYDEVKDDVIPGSSGRTKAFAEKFSNWKEEDDHKVKKTIEIERATGSCVIENVPEEREDVVKSGGPSGWEIDFEAVAGRTSGLLNQWKQNIEGDSDSDTNSLPRKKKDKPFWLQEIAAARETKDVYENEPEELEGVLREQDVNPDETQVNLQTGHARNLRSMWANRESELADEEKRKNAEKGQQLIRFTPPREKTPEMIYQPELVSTQKITLGSGGATSPPPTSPPNQNYDSHTNYTQSSTSYSYENGTNVDSYDNTNNNYEDSYQNYSSYNGEAYDGESYSEAYDSFQAPPSTATLNLSQPTTSTATMSFSSGPSPDEQPRRTSVTRLVLKKASAS